MREIIVPTVSEEDELCPVCDGSGLLLKEPCPLCDTWDEVEQQPRLGTEVVAIGATKGDHKVYPWRLSKGERQATCFTDSKVVPPTPLNPKSPLCLVLDIDGTMLSESENVNPSSMASLQRPHLAEFLDFVFESFAAVAIWTAGSQEWLDAFLQAVDPDGKRPWAFAWSFSRISWLRQEGTSFADSPPVFQHVKRLSKIWKNKSLRAKGFLPHTTLIVDNNPAVCRASYGNAIYIKTYSDMEASSTDATSSEDDDWLLVLLHYLNDLHETQVPGETVRHIDKRGWYPDTGARLRQRAHTA